MADASGDFAPNTSDDFPPNMPVVVFVGETTLAFALERKKHKMKHFEIHIFIWHKLPCRD